MSDPSAKERKAQLMALEALEREELAGRPSAAERAERDREAVLSRWEETEGAYGGDPKGGPLTNYADDPDATWEVGDAVVEEPLYVGRAEIEPPELQIGEAEVEPRGVPWWNRGPQWNRR